MANFKAFSHILTRYYIINCHTTYVRRRHLEAETKIIFLAQNQPCRGLDCWINAFCVCDFIKNCKLPFKFQNENLPSNLPSNYSSLFQTTVFIRTVKWYFSSRKGITGLQIWTEYYLPNFVYPCMSYSIHKEDHNSLYNILTIIKINKHILKTVPIWGSICN